MLIFGDFNAHHLAWGNKFWDSKVGEKKYYTHFFFNSDRKRVRHEFKSNAKFLIKWAKRFITDF